MIRHRDSSRWLELCRQRWASLRGVGGLRVLAALGGGLLVYAGFAPSTAWWAPIIGVALLGVAIHGRGWKAAAGLGFLFGAATLFPLLSWTNIYVGNVPWFALVIAESVLVMPAGVLIALASRHLPWWPAWAAAAWIAGEVLRGVFPFGGFPWANVAFTQASGPLLPLSAVVGEAGLGFAVALCGFALAELTRRSWRLYRSAGGAGAPALHRAVRVVTTPVIVVALPFLGAVLSQGAMLSGNGAPKKTVAMVQGNVPEPGLEFNARRRAVLDMHGEETARLAADIDDGVVPQPDMVLWSENSSDIDPYRDPDATAVINRAAREVGVPILVGAVVQSGTPGKVYNKAIVWDPVTGPGETYTKRHPVPFAEYVPYRDFFRFFSKQVDNVRADFLPGSKPGNLTIAGVPVGDVICFEVVEDGLVRDVVNGGAEMLVVQTNNATFGYTDETYQQQAMSRVRAVEYGREVLIVAISGVSAVIGPDGSVQDTLPLYTAGYMVPQVPLISDTTIATSLGAPVQWFLTAATPLALLALLFLRWRGRRSADGEDETSSVDGAESVSEDAQQRAPAGV